MANIENSTTFYRLSYASACKRDDKKARMNEKQMAHL